MAYVLTSEGLGKNAMHSEIGRGGYFPAGSGTTETQALLVRGALRAYEATGISSYLDNARKYANVLIKYYFFNTEPPTSGLWPCQWIVNADAPFKFKGPVNAVSSQLSGSVDTTVAFTSGLATVSNLAQVYRVFSDTGTLSWPNVFAGLTSGTEYTVDSYHDMDGNGFHLSATTSTYFETNVAKAGQIQLGGVEATFTGNASVSYATFVASPTIAFGANFECWPMWRQMGSGEWNCAADSLHWCYDAFDLLVKHDATQTVRWTKARDAILRMWTSCLTWDNSLYITKKTADATAAYNNDPLTFFILTQGGVDFVAPSVPASPVGYVHPVRNASGYIEVVLPIDAGRAKFRWANESIYINGIYAVDADCLNLNIGSTGTQEARVLLTDADGKSYQTRWTWAAGAVPTSTVSIPLSWFCAGYSWGAGSVSLWGDGSGYHGSLPDANSGLGFAPSGTVVTPSFTYTTTSASIMYRITDTAGVGAWTAMAAGTHTILPSYTGTIKNIDFLNSLTAADTIIISSITGVTDLKSPVHIRKVWVDFESPAATTLQIGDIWFSGAVQREVIKYSGGGLPFQISSNSPRGGLTGITNANFQGPYYMGYQNPVPFIGLNDYAGAEIMMNMLIDSQTAYLASTGVNGPYAPAYLPMTWDSTMFGPADTFGWLGPDPNTFWGAFQYRAFCSIADFWAQAVAKPVSNAAVTKAASSANLFLTWLDTWLTDNPTEVMVPSVFNQAAVPQVTYNDPQMIALALKGAIFAKKAGADSAKTGRVIPRLYAMLVGFNITGGAMEGSFTPDPTNGIFYGFWAGEILDALALYLLNP